MQTLAPADARFVAGRRRVCRWWPAFLVIALAAVGVAAGALLQAVPELADPTKTFEAALLGQLSDAVAQRLAAIGIISTLAALLAVTGAILVSVGRQVTERRLLRILSTWH
ncbi:MAG: hypothetical protein AAF458_24780 [Pseudomonadota bacterium]